MAIALVHYPVLGRGGDRITTAITNLDLHDIARSACTYGAEAFFVVHPVEAQRTLAERIRDHWVHGSGAKRIPTREPAMKLLRITSSLDDVYAALGGREQVDVYATSARESGRSLLDFPMARRKMECASHTNLLLLGTGWGLAPELIDSADALLEPIVGSRPDGYNHLSVRAACAIALDRLRSYSR